MYTYLVCGPFVQLISREISQATSSLTFLTRNSILKAQDSRLETQYSKLSRISIKSQGSRDCQLIFERYCTREGCSKPSWANSWLAGILISVLKNFGAVFCLYWKKAKHILIPFSSMPCRLKNIKSCIWYECCKQQNSDTGYSQAKFCEITLGFATLVFHCLESVYFTINLTKKFKKSCLWR